MCNFVCVRVFFIYLGEVVLILTLLEGISVEVCRLIGQLSDDSVFHLIYMVNKSLLKGCTRQRQTREKTPDKKLLYSKSHINPRTLTPGSLTVPGKDGSKNKFPLPLFIYFLRFFVKLSPNSSQILETECACDAFFHFMRFTLT